jgi:hypothetical protein
MSQRSVKQFVVLGLALAVLAWPSIGRADYLTTNDNLPPLGGEYVSPAGWAALYYPPGVMVKDVVLSNFSLTFPPPPPGPGTSVIHSFSEQVDGMFSVNGGATYESFVLPGNETDRITSGVDVGNVRNFDTEMLQLDITGPSSVGTIMIRESPTKASTGHTSITYNGNGTCMISSFFDVFTELSIDGGQTWIPDMNAPAHLTLVPEPSSVVLLAVALLALAGWVRRRR